MSTSCQFVSIEFLFYVAFFFLPATVMRLNYFLPLFKFTIVAMHVCLSVHELLLWFLLLLLFS